MTKLHLQGPRLVRETAVTTTDGPIVLELAARYLVVRIKSKRSEETLSVSYEALLDFARKLEFRRKGGRL